MWKRRSIVGERFWRIRMMGRCYRCMQIWYGRARRMLRVLRLILIKRLKQLLMTGNKHQTLGCSLYGWDYSLFIICLWRVWTPSTWWIKLKLSDDVFFFFILPYHCRLLYIEKLLICFINNYYIQRKSNWFIV